MTKRLVLYKDELQPFVMHRFININIMVSKFDAAMFLLNDYGNDLLIYIKS